MWEPWRPLTLAEQAVDFPAHLDHIVTQRDKVTRLATPAARRVAIALVDLHGYPPLALQAKLSQALATGLDETARFGYRQARHELAQLRSIHAASYPEEQAGFAVVQRRIAIRAKTTVDAISRKIAARVQAAVTLNRTDLVLAAVDTAQRALRNSVLDLVGETLNWGRAQGVLTLPRPPVFAMRSEIMDTATCTACDSLDGAILQIGSPEFVLYMPPAGCFGGGRCRGVYVFADRVSDVRGPDTAPGPQPALPPIPPLPIPQRKAA